MAWTVVSVDMTDATAPDSPLERLADTVGEATIEAFEMLSNDTRVAILLALWEAKNPGPPLNEPSDPPVPFSELRARVGVRDPGQFNYHLDKLRGTFVESTDDGYRLTTPAEQVLSAVFAGTLSDQPSFENEPIDAECNRCGASVVIDYRDGTIIERCTRCEGLWATPEDQPGMLARGYLPPIGLKNRTPQEFHRTGNIWTRHRLYSMMEGACPDCSGTVSTSISVCDDHGTGGGSVCEHCGGLYEFQTLFACDVCKAEWWVPAHAPIFTDGAVTAFFFAHGLDPDELYDASATEELGAAIERAVVRSEDPLELVVTAALDGDQLDVVLDGDARVIDVSVASGG